MTTRFPNTHHTAGTTYSRAGLYALPAGDWSAAATVKRANGELVQALVVSFAALDAPDENGNTHALSVLATATETASWPIGTLLVDTIFTDASTIPVKVPAQTVQINVSAHTVPLSDADNPLQVITPDMAPVLRGETGPAYPSEAAQAATEAARDAALAAQVAAEAAEADAAGHASAAAGSAGAAAASESTAAAAASSASTSAGTATTQAGIATAQAGTATSQASAASASAGAASASASAAAGSASGASTSASTATTQAGIATTKAGEAAASAVTATTQATTATTQAGIATTKAGEAAASAASAAAAVVTETDNRIIDSQQLAGGVAYATDMALLTAREMAAVSATVLTYDLTLEQMLNAMAHLLDLAGVTARAIAGGDVVLRAGTAGGPSLRPDGDPNTGVFFPAADVAALATNGLERLRVDANGNLGIGTTAPSGLLDVADNRLRVRTAKTPASATAAGNAGEICWDASYLYICTSTNVWRRAAHATW